MKHRLAAITLGLVVAVSGLPRTGAQTPALPTIDQILDKYVTAVGGRAAVEKVVSVHGRGTIQIPEAGLNGTVEVFQKSPDKSLTVVDLAGMGRQREGVDGTVAWADDPVAGLREKSGAEATEAKRAAVFPRELKMKTLYPTMTVKGRERVGTREAFLVEAVPADGRPIRFYFDAESGLIIRQVATRESPQGALEVDIALDDYRVVGGVKRAFSIKQSTAAFTVVIQFSDVQPNEAIDDAVFKKPS